MKRIVSPHPIFLKPEEGLRRRPYLSELSRPDSFWEGFDEFGLFYDVFRDISDERVWLVGPSPANLKGELEAAIVVGDQSGVVAKLQFQKSRSACVAYVDLPEEDVGLTMRIGSQTLRATIGRNLASDFAGMRVLCCINNNNDLNWIADWAKFYQKEHSANAVVVFDNNSSRYTKSELTAVLEGVEGLDQSIVVDWPFHFGTMDKIAQDNGQNGYVRFAQPVMYMSLYLRMASKARSILNVDIDELVLSNKGRSIFEATEKRWFGCTKFHRYLVENVLAPGSPGNNSVSFSDFVYRSRKQLGPQDKFKKWAMSPGRVKPRQLVAQPNTHWVDGVWNPYPVSREFKCYHFAGINTGWRANTQKGELREWQHERHFAKNFDPELHLKDEILAKKLDEIFG